MAAVLVGLLLACIGVVALTYLVEDDRVLADKYRPSTGDPMWDDFYETQEIPAHGEVLP
jgi:hypothetical protein